MKEVFKPIAFSKGFYEVSNLGNVRRRPIKAMPEGELIGRHTVGRVALPVRATGNFPTPGQKSFNVAALVLEAFGRTKPAPTAVPVNIDGNKSNCALKNLAWRPRSERIAQGRTQAEAQRTAPKGKAKGTTLAKLKSTITKPSAEDIGAMWVDRRNYLR